jgi:hypothetical protein
MPLAERFRRVALIAVISLVIGISTLANLLKQPASPDETLARAALASPSERPAVPLNAPPANAAPPVKAVTPEVSPPVTTAVAPAPTPQAAPAPVPVAAPAPPAAAPPPAQAAEFPPMQPMTDEAVRAPAASRPQQASRSEKPAAEKPAAEKPVAEKPVAEKPDVRRAADGRAKRKSARPAPYPMRDFLASHR